VETGDVQGSDVEWLDDLRIRDNFLSDMHGEDIRSPFDDGTSAKGGVVDSKEE
jgi:hypothetical protein